MSVHVFPILKPPPTSLPIPSLWVIPVHQPRAHCIMHQIWTDDSFHIWYFTCFNGILPYHPTLILSHKVQKTVQYVCASFSVQTDSLLSVPSWNQSPSLLPSPHFLFFQGIVSLSKSIYLSSNQKSSFPAHRLFHFLPFSFLCLK